MVDMIHYIQVLPYHCINMMLEDTLAQSSFNASGTGQ